MKTADLDLNGMFAVLTPQGLERQLRRVEGVLDVSVDPATGQTRIEFDEAETSLRAVRSFLVECGYHCAMEVMPDAVCDPEVGRGD